MRKLIVEDRILEADDIRYNTRERDIEVTTIAFQRSLTVIIGTLWSALVSRYWWPFTARRELRMGISEYVNRINQGEVADTQLLSGFILPIL
jgi:hypothetical protein